MDDDFQLSDVEAAQAFLRDFGREARRGGHGLFHRGAVTDLQVVQPGKSFRALVQDASSAYRVELARSGQNWTTACQCHSFVHCAHIFAAMYALLAEHRAAVVRQLSTGQVSSQPPAAVPKKKADSHPELSLPDRVRSALGRKVTNPEMRFLTHLHDLYQRCGRTHQIAYSDIQGLGFVQLNGYGWIFPKIWPSFPDTEYEFWLYLANFLNQQGAQIPEFMVPVTKLSLIEERIARWRRAAEVEKWKKSFNSLDVAEDAAVAEGEIDLRLIIEGTAARLQMRRPDQAEFEPFRQQQYRQMESDHRAGRVNFTTEGEVLWQLFTSAVLQGMKLDLDSYDTNVIHVVGRILRTRALQGRVVDASGTAITRFPDRLRWEVSSAETLEDDYRFKLVQQDGTPPPPILCVIPGRPILYLTTTGVFPGPGGGKEVLDPSGENLIPAAAIESADGVAFLDALGVELPPRLKDRVRKLPWEVSISCALQPAYPGSDVDECTVAVQARAEDGRKQSWDGLGWAAKSNPQRKSKKQEGAITLYDAATLNLVPAFASTIKPQARPLQR